MELKPGSNWLKLQKKSQTTRRKGKVVKGSQKTKGSQKAKDAHGGSTKTLIDSINDELEKRQGGARDPEALKQWAEEHDIAAKDLSDAYNLPRSKINTSEPVSKQKQSIGKYLAIDCEFVGVGPQGTEDALARVSIVNFHGHTVYDRYVKPRERVVDWRTWVSGIQPHHMKEAIDFKTAQKEVSDLLDGKVLVGHAVDHDLDALLLSHPKSMIRDTSRFAKFRKLSKGKTPGLKKLAKELLNMDIQGGEHSSVEDAKATMLLYKLEKKEFEKTYLRTRH
ncbi:putative 3'-5' exonuclease [Cyberlindnera jadinii NRRL Y-1542]|uniref:RNA exonuclease 4 n=1 Tax=Cyberlindnera jadinii (strain ATCC 18201 / CBS 1600 / BCRC 20928 / JCM 3617 / NBRC 0987 / NRRL Y-1542) TaxID=983966 RepID=A0A1E4RVM8_CYBJN|nr:RNA exonuclease 4 [Cyberlindnera jadinii NRRL Y-1542]ODV71308.1 RNA exonuclease 4 [Cyberlindnera jadinii NRRL Y-1542]